MLRRMWAAVGIEKPAGMLADMPFDDGLDDDLPSFRAPPPPDDRLWRHPSEMAATLMNPARARAPWAVALLSGMVGALLAAGTVALAIGDRHDVTHERVVERQGPANPSAIAPGAVSVVDIAQRARPAIVQIKVTGAGGQASGSGVIFESDGHLLTNFHVVDGADAIKVVLASGREVTGSLVGVDRDSDVAVVKIDGGPYAVATLGSAIDLKVGQQAIAIGDPLGLAGGPSVTVGVVSALHRSVDSPSGAELLDMIQTDAPISPGSSGGALLDNAGNVIGITTAIAVSEVGAEGLGFATPIDLARLSAGQILTTGKVTHVWIGVEGTDVDSATAADLDIDGGAVVGRVIKDGPADKAGIVARDVIVAIDSRPIGNMGTLVVALRAHKPGDVVTLDLIREHARRTMRVTLAVKPANPG